MHSSTSRFVYLLDRYHNETASEQETSELLQLLREASDDELAGLLHQEWEGSQTGDALFKPSASAAMLEKILRAARQDLRPVPVYRKRHYLWIRKFAAAAAVLILVAFGVYLGTERGQVTEQDPRENRLVNDALPAGNKATLTLPAGKTIILDHAQNGILTKQGNIRVNKTRDGLLTYEAGENGGGQDIAFHTLSTPRGGQYQLVLPDGSKVWLNAASSLKFPASFKGRERIVELQGEAYFEVAKDPAMPFKVRSGTAEVEVLGTHFNIMAYEDESSMRTTLLEGSVKVRSEGGANILSPGEQAVLARNGSMKIIRNINTDEAVAWKNGLFQFSDTDLQTIMREVARWYDLDISYKGPISPKYFTGKISRSVKASELLRILQYTGVDFEIRGKEIIVTN